ncbi:MAG: hypothetical protein HC904_17415 [Blastochloris sp.]|nr:hypothetical protein [Blastochloris sp.]
MQLAVLLALTVTSCMDADPFGLSSRRIAGKYQLERFEGGNYYLLKDGHEGSGGGYLDGTILEIGWDSDTIAAKRCANFRGDPDGWMIIDLKSDKLTGPVTEEVFRKSYPSLKSYDPETAWKKL